MLLVVATTATVAAKREREIYSVDGMVVLVNRRGGGVILTKRERGRRWFVGERRHERGREKN